MIHKLKTISALILVASLCACTSYNPNGYMNYQSYTWDGEPLYPESYDGSYGSQDYRQYQQESKKVVVPDTYYVGSYHSPVRASDSDRNWVHQQSPSGYTIEIAEGNKASSVAGKLQKAPKSNRRAQVKSYQNGRPVYKGLYGSYNSYDAAKQALDALPDDLKSGANIKSWGSVQGASN